MEKQFLLLIPLFLLLVAPAYAKQNDNENKPEKNRVAAEVNISVTPTRTCEKYTDWKNHGEYVSCIAQQKLGGKVVSEAAKSDIGKKVKENEEGEYKKHKDPKPTVSVTPSASPSVEPSATPSGTPYVQVPKNQVQAIVTVLEQILNFFKSLL